MGRRKVIDASDQRAKLNGSVELLRLAAIQAGDLAKVFGSKSRGSRIPAFSLPGWSVMRCTAPRQLHALRHSRFASCAWRKSSIAGAAWLGSNRLLIGRRFE